MGSVIIYQHICNILRDKVFTARTLGKTLIHKIHGLATIWAFDSEVPLRESAHQTD